MTRIHWKTGFLPAFLIGMSFLLGMHNGSFSAAPRERGSDRLIPLQTGNYWVYQGKVKWTDPRSGSVREETMTWRMQVLGVVERPGVLGAVLRGHPQDLAWYDTGRPPGEYLMVLTHGKYYLLQDKRAKEVLARLYDGRDDLKGLVTPEDLYLATHEIIAGGSRSGDPAAEAVWQLEAVGRADLAALRGPLTSRYARKYMLVQRAPADDARLELVPGVGITGFRYRHHGTIAETDLRLVEYDAG